MTIRLRISPTAASPEEEELAGRVNHQILLVQRLRGRLMQGRTDPGTNKAIASELGELLVSYARQHRDLSNLELLLGYLHVEKSLYTRQLKTLNQRYPVSSMRVTTVALK